MSALSDFDHFEVIITTRPARKRGETSDPYFAIQAVISAGAGYSYELAYLSPTTLRMGYTYIALSAYRFLADNGIDVTKTTITFGWKQHDDTAQASS